MGPARWSLPAALLLLLALAAGGAEAQDITPPYFMVSWNDLTFEATSSAGAFVDFSSQVSAADDSADTFVVTCTPAKFTLFPMGNTSVECTATDSSGNQAYEQFVITVVDTTPPTLDIPPSPLTIEANAIRGAYVQWEGRVNATDLIDAAPEVECDSPSGGGFLPMGTSTVNCTATDEAGNAAWAMFDVQVVDTTLPVFFPVDYTMEANVFAGALVNATDLARGTVLDIADPDPVVSCDPPAGILFALGSTTNVSCTVTDASGNQANATFQVLVVRTLPCPGGAAADAAGYLFHQGTDVDTGNSTVDLVCFFHGGAGSESVADLGEMCDSTPECAAFTVRRNSTTAAAAVEICLVVISNGTTPAELALTSDTQPFMFQSCMGIYVRNDVQTGPSSPNGTATNSGSSCSPAVLVFNETAGPTSGHLTSDYGLIPGSDAFAAFLPPRGPVPGGDPAAWLRPYESRTRCAWLFNAGINPGAYASGTTIVQATKLTVRFLSINSPFDRLEVWSLRSSITTPEQLNAVLTHLAANQSSISPEAAALLVNPTAPYAALSGLARDGNLLPIVMYGSFIMYLRTDTVGSAPGFWVEYETQPSSGHLGEMNTQIHIQNDMYHDNSFSSLAVHGSGPCGRRLLFVQQPLFQQGIWVTDCRNDADPVV
ncbi:hypothetical protein HYH03_005390 [Edaphochlamys debaryana]|uniref:HYR domain-containing protein n=1 Tax=Edaphochlamys debaryana TaxID=47281 RepID=A0A835Y876_9CHLO|nr:hypothetical protein HYH03_005390 [Edaphochlamys debaryana]|eukprot:KAG2496568.1 hypothetical protein HYH03_005390 [Edaphochlamys debaryana]